MFDFFSKTYRGNLITSGFGTVADTLFPVFGIASAFPIVYECGFHYFDSVHQLHVPRNFVFLWMTTYKGQSQFKYILPNGIAEWQARESFVSF